MISRNDPCFCGSGKKWKKCHYPQAPFPSFDTLREEYQKKYQICLKTPQEIDGIKAASKLAANILKKLCAKAKIGVTTNELDRYAYQLHQEAGAIPAPLNYGNPPYPNSICTSLNEVICHGIPDDRPLQEGDIMNIDVSPILNGYIGDCSAMVCIGEVSSEKSSVVDVAYQCLMQAIQALKPGMMLYEIGDIIEGIATKHGFSVVDEFVGHGVGLQFHEPPQVPHHKNRMRIPLAPGMIFTIEPMINVGKRKSIIDEENGWIARTIDGKPSAQWEHTVLITEDGHEILTIPEI